MENSNNKQTELINNRWKQIFSDSRNYYNIVFNAMNKITLEFDNQRYLEEIESIFIDFDWLSSNATKEEMQIIVDLLKYPIKDNAKDLQSLQNIMLRSLNDHKRQIMSIAY